MFAVFFSGFTDRYEYGSDMYSHHHPQLSSALIDYLIEHSVSLIGLDFAGMRRGKEHTPADQRCADAGVFVIENLHNLDRLLAYSDRFTAVIRPLGKPGSSGMPCLIEAQPAEE